MLQTESAQEYTTGRRDAVSNAYTELVQKEWDHFVVDNDVRPNIMLLGATGCGKSSFVNLVFGSDVAEISDAARGTDAFTWYMGSQNGTDVNLLDSRGYEMEDGYQEGESCERYMQEIRHELARSRNESAMGKIHLVFYCISVASERIEPYDLKVLKELRDDPDLHRRIAVVLTKCDEDDEDGTTAQRFREIIQHKVGKLPVFEVSTDPDFPLELDALMAWGADALGNEDLREAFVASQRGSLREKEKLADTRIKYYMAGAGAIGATPIPISDAIPLTALQVTMAANIIHIYGLSDLAHISKAVLGNFVVSNLGKAIAGGLLKLVPGIGTLAGGLINAAVATSITGAIGYAVNTLCSRSCEKILRGETVDFSHLFDFVQIQQLASQYIKNRKEGR